MKSCANTASDNCASWGEPGGGRASVYYLLDASLDGTAGTADVKADIRDVLLPAWSQKATRSPTLSSCTVPATCNYDVLVRIGTTTELGGNLAVTVFVNVGAGAPATFQYLEVRIKDMSYSHPCGTVDDGCTVGGDDRPLISHELGHTVGLGHCDLNLGAMCHTTSTTTNEQAEGTMFWTPQPRDILAIKAIYP